MGSIATTTAGTTNKLMWRTEQVVCGIMDEINTCRTVQVSESTELISKVSQSRAWRKCGRKSDLLKRDFNIPHLSRLPR